MGKGYWFVKTLSYWGEAVYIHNTLPNLREVMTKHRLEKVPISTLLQPLIWPLPRLFLGPA